MPRLRAVSVYEPLSCRVRCRSGRQPATVAAPNALTPDVGRWLSEMRSTPTPCLQLSGESHSGIRLLNRLKTANCLDCYPELSVGLDSCHNQPAYFCLEKEADHEPCDSPPEGRAR